LPPFASRDVAYGNPEVGGRTLELHERILATGVEVEPELFLGACASCWTDPWAGIRRAGVRELPDTLAASRLTDLARDRAGPWRAW
jgi:hypothetical protein